MSSKSAVFRIEMSSFPLLRRSKNNHMLSARFGKGLETSTSAGSSLLKQHIKIRGKTPSSMPEKESIHWVGDVGVDGFGIEVIGEIEATDRKSHRVFRIDLYVFGYPGIDGQESRISILVGQTDVVL